MLDFLWINALTCSSLAHQTVVINNRIRTGGWHSGIFQFELLYEININLYEFYPNGSYFVWMLKLTKWLFDFGVFFFKKKKWLKENLLVFHSACDFRIKKALALAFIVQY